MGVRLPVPLCPLTGVQGPFPGSVAVSQVHLSITTLPSGSVRAAVKGVFLAGFWLLRVTSPGSSTLMMAMATSLGSFDSVSGVPGSLIVTVVV